MKTLSALVILAIMLLIGSPVAMADESAAAPRPPEQSNEAKRTYVTAQSGTVVRETVDPEPIVLKIDPELFAGGMFSNYRSLGHFAYAAFGGGVGVTYIEHWHFKFSIWALTEPHTYHPPETITPASGAPIKYQPTPRLWFVQPALYALYNLAHYKDYHYWFPMDLYLGVKLGMNVFLTEMPFADMDDTLNVLWGIVLMPRFYVWEGFGIAPLVEISTIDYFRNFFLHYGLSVFWDFELIGAPPSDNP